MYKKAILFLFVLLLVFSSANTVKADIDLDIITDNFYLSPGMNTLVIKGENGESYGISVLGSYRGWVTFKKNFVDIEHGQGEVNFSITPPEKTKSGVYRFPIMVYSTDEDNYFYIIEDYELIIQEITDVRINDFKIEKDTYKPGEKITATWKVRNTGTDDEEELKIYISYIGEDYEVNRENTFSLNIGKEKSFSETFDTSLNPEPGNYHLDIQLVKYGKKMDSNKAFLEIEGIANIEKEHDSSWWLLQESGIFELKNTGNLGKTETVKMEIQRPWDWFILFSEMPETNYEGSLTIYTWEVRLEPGESKTISYDIHYWPFAVIIIILLYGLYFALKQMKKPCIKKHSIETRILEDDNKEVVVAIEVKTGGKKMKKAVLEDFVPSMAKVKKEFKTMKPKLEKTDRGTKVKWNLGNLDKNENLILSYRFKTMIGTTGYFKLPKAVLKAKVNKVWQEYFSNSLKVED